MIEKYLQYLDKYNGYFYEYIPHILNKSKTWEFYLKDGTWTIGLEKNVKNPAFDYKEIIAYCQKEQIDLIVLESLLMQCIINKGVYLQIKNQQENQAYKDLIQIISEETLSESLKQWENFANNIVKIVKKSQLSIV